MQVDVAIPECEGFVLCCLCFSTPVTTGDKTHPAGFVTVLVADIFIPHLQEKNKWPRNILICTRCNHRPYGFVLHKRVLSHQLVSFMICKLNSVSVLQIQLQVYIHR